MSAATPQPCVCRGDEQPGLNGTFWCAQHQCRKTQHWRDLCMRHEEFRRAWEEGSGPGRPVTGRSRPANERQGPGSELRRDMGCCGCTPFYKQMDEWGPDVCLERIDTIIQWMREEGQKCKMPVSEQSARHLILKAIERARASKVTSP